MHFEREFVQVNLNGEADARSARLVTGHAGKGGRQSQAPETGGLDGRAVEL